MLDEPRQQRLTGDDDRRRVTRAREAAEALFAPKQPPPKTLAVKSPLPADRSEHKPRVLSIAPPPLPCEKADLEIHPVSGAAPTISHSQVACIRTWLKYGMTVAQEAAVYGVAVDEIERALRPD